MFKAAMRQRYPHVGRAEPGEVRKPNACIARIVNDEKGYSGSSAEAYPPNIRRSTLEPSAMSPYGPVGRWHHHRRGNNVRDQQLNKIHNN
ncbi:hypothetical protein EVAR_72603_1 [Eumeta japonica]|uniref:Uncharacterized protein n=1 Tax=Eumeta variegata TaxID=151549 RepID=A0A4C1T766_EUMVA|nr:hypothetical protein EVAR_72603_1 [Eumeta japonica]